MTRPTEIVLLMAVLRFYDGSLKLDVFLFELIPKGVVIRRRILGLRCVLNSTDKNSVSN